MKKKWLRGALLLLFGLVLIGASVWIVTYEALSTVIKSQDADDTPPEDIVTVVASPTDQEDYVAWIGYQSGVVKSKSSKLLDSPSDDGGVICRINANSSVTVMERRGNWARIRYRGYTGWIKYNHIHKTSDLVEYDISSGSDIPAIEDLAGTDAQAALDTIAKDFRCVGVQAAIIKNGEVRYTYEYGYANRKQEIPIESDSKIRIASLSKVMVGMSAMAMCEQGLISLDDDVSDHLGYTVRNPRYDDTPITLRSLLTHTSSINEVTLNYDKPKSLKDTLSKKKTYSGNRPGLRGTFSYCNAGYNTAGATLECAADMTLVDYTDGYFFDMLGVDASYYAPNVKARDKIATLYSDGAVKMSVDDLLARPYYEKPGQNFCFYAGGLIISAQDYARLICILIGDGTYHDTYYLSPESVDQMQTEQYDMDDFKQCITLRHRSDHIDGRDLYYHTGNAYGVLSYASYDESTGDGIVVITTGSPVSDKSKGVYLPCKRIAEYCYGELLR